MLCKYIFTKANYRIIFKRSIWIKKLFCFRRIKSSINQNFFSIETEDFEIKLYPEFISIENENTDKNIEKILLGSYLAGVLKNKNKKKTMPKTSDGIKQELKVYKILKKNKNISKF